MPDSAEKNCCPVHLHVVWQDSVTLCTLGMGTAFGESILNDSPRHSTVVTREYCELLRVEQKDFKILWEVRDRDLNRPDLRRSTCKHCYIITILEPRNVRNKRH